MSTDIRQIKNKGEVFYPLTHVDAIVGDDGNSAIDSYPTAGSGNLVSSGGIHDFVLDNAVYDISLAKATGGVLAEYTDLAAALGTNGVNVPASERRGGMSVKFVQTFDHKYVRFNYLLEDSTTNSKFTSVNNWQGVTEKAVASNIKNLIEGEGVAKAIFERTSVLDCNFDFRHGSVAQYANRHFKFNFVSGRRYKIEVLTTDNSVTTYFSTRNGETVVQNNLCQGSGVRTSTFTCGGNATDFYMSLNAAMQTGVLYEVRLTDLSSTYVDAIPTYQSYKGINSDGVYRGDGNVKATLGITRIYKGGGSTSATNHTTDILLKAGVCYILHLRCNNPVYSGDTSASLMLSCTGFSNINRDVTTNIDLIQEYTPVSDVYLALSDRLSAQTEYSVYAVEKEQAVRIQQWLISNVYDYADAVLNIDSTKIERPSITWSTGYWIKSGSKSSKSGYVLSDKLFLQAGKIISFYSGGKSENAPMIIKTDENETSYTTIVSSNIYNIRRFTYKATSDCYIILQGAVNTVFGVIIVDSSSTLEKIENIQLSYISSGAFDDAPTYNSNKIPRSKGVYDRFSEESAIDGRTFSGNGSGTEAITYIVTDLRLKAGKKYIIRFYSPLLTYGGDASANLMLAVTGFSNINKSFSGKSIDIIKEYTPSSDIYVSIGNRLTSDTQFSVTVCEKDLMGDEQVLYADGVLGIDNSSILRPFTFTNTGYFINSSRQKASSSNYNQSNKVQLLKGQTVSFSACVYTGTRIPMIVVTDENETFYNNVVYVKGGTPQQRTRYSYKATADCYVILQCSIETAYNAFIYTDSQRLADIEDDVEDLNDAVVELSEMTIFLPDYVIEERDRVYRELLNDVNGERILMAFNTDQHIDPSKAGSGDADDPKYVVNGLKALNYIGQLLPIDIMCLGGDTCGYLTTTINGIMDSVNIVNNPLSTIKTPVVSIAGNHDGGQNNANIVGKGLYNVHSKRIQFENYWHKYGGVDTGCGYIDDALHNIRYVFVDTGTRYGKTTSLWDFVSNCFSTLPNGYKAIIYSHHPLTTEFNGVIKAEDAQGNLTNAFQDCLSIVQDRVEANYADKVIACINGHGHVDAYGVSQSGILFIQTTCACPHSRPRHFGNIPNNPTLGTFTDTSYDFFIIDQEAQTIEAIRYGQGSNRKWYYKGTNIGLISNTNCLSGTCSVASVTLTFTDGDNNVITADVDANKHYEVYLELAKAYTITCSGYTVSENTVTLMGNSTKNIVLT